MEFWRGTPTKTASERENRNFVIPMAFGEAQLFLGFLTFALIVESLR
jgi:hypothetical protein